MTTRKATPVRSLAGRAEDTADKPVDRREQRLFRSLDTDNDQLVCIDEFIHVLAETGLSTADVRLTESLDSLRAASAPPVPPVPERPVQRISRDLFCDAIRPNILLIERALQGRLVIPDFGQFTRDIDDIFDTVRANRDGAPASYIPQLDLRGAAADQFGLALCTIDGQRHAAGDSTVSFSVQSACKPINYCLALEAHGPDVVHNYIGHEPSGVSFNELTLDGQGRPHNPMINAGAIMSSALIDLAVRQAGAGDGMAGRSLPGTRLEYVLDRWQALAGGARPSFNMSVYLSERETADRNFALAYHMRENHAFPDGVDLHDVLDFYFQNCSLDVTVEMMSVIAATLANGGICPLTGEAVLDTQAVRHCLSLMSSCGMYDYSGEFAFTIGLPAKSGVSGAIMIVIPNVMGLCVWSPRLDGHGNSVRGIDFCGRLVDRFNFHNYDNLTGQSSKRDPRVNQARHEAKRINELIWAASKGDLGAMQDRLGCVSELRRADYDRRTPLHLAAAENRAEVVRYFIDRKAMDGDKVDLEPKDRWGGTPLDDAYLHGHQEIISLLEAAGCRRGAHRLVGRHDNGGDSPDLIESLQVAELIWAASRGDVTEICRLVAQGVPLDSADYDRRTAAHLAAAEGHADLVRYFLAQGVRFGVRDRWGNTPLDEAKRHGQREVAALIAGPGPNDNDKTETKDVA